MITFNDLLRLKEETFEYFTLEESLKAVRYNGWYLNYVKYQTDEICLEAVKQNGFALQFVINQTEEICIEAYKQNSISAQYIRIDIKDKELRKIRNNKFIFLTEEESLEAVRKYGWNLELVKHQTPEICLEAVRQNGWALRYVYNQTEEICLEAYKQHPGSILYIRNAYKAPRQINVKSHLYDIDVSKSYLRNIDLSNI